MFLNLPVNQAFLGVFPVLELLKRIWLKRDRQFLPTHVHQKLLNYQSRT